MQRIARLRNPIMPYAWGSRRALRALRGLPGESAEPEAELWLGGHPKAPSEVEVDGTWKPLPEVIAADPEAALGPAVVGRFGPSLPFLLKVLAAGEPLSIQAHPDRAQAEAGFAREEAAGVSVTAPNRNYRDRGHKPEVIYALTPFVMMRGFRTPTAIADRVARLRLGDHWPEVAALAATTDAAAGLRTFLASCLRMDPARADRLVSRAVAAIGPRIARGEADVAEDWVVRLAKHYPGDAGALAPLWLRVTTLAPGEAAFTGPGVLHAYLDGTGIELMSSSDNVLRGGLTPKHIDVDELLDVLRFVPGDDGRVAIEPEATTPASRVLRVQTPAEEMELVAITLAGELERGPRSSAEIVLCTEGRGQVTTSAQTESIPCGESVFVPASAPTYRLSGDGTFFVASVPDSGAAGTSRAESSEDSGTVDC